jgi:hypothetical protein
MNLMGYDGGFPRPPLRPVNAAAVNELRSALERAGVSLPLSQA